MIRTLLARISQGHRTMRWPDGPPPALPERFRGLPSIDAARCPEGCRDCANACPTEAIVLGDNYELSFTDRRQAIYPKEMLLEPVPTVEMTTPRKVEPGLFTRSVPEMKDPRD